MKLPLPPPEWSQGWQQRTNQAHEINDLGVRKKRTDVDLGPGEKLIISSPDKRRWSIEVSNAGVITAVLAP